MQSYRDESTVSGSTSTLNPVNASGAAGGAGLAGMQFVPANGTAEMGKYRSLYEQNMNPFEAFRGRVSLYRFPLSSRFSYSLQEAARAVQGLNPIERGVLSFTRQILGNRRARTFFIFYAFGLHLLVVFMLFECASRR